jgi:hypothetical protein
MNILLAITFVFGVLRLFTATKLFDITLGYFFGSLFGVHNKRNNLFEGLLVAFDVWFFYFSLIFQSWWWLFK